MKYIIGANMVGVPWKRVMYTALSSAPFISICCILSRLLSRPIGMGNPHEDLS